MTYGYKIVQVVNIYDELKRNHLSDEFEEKYFPYSWAIYAFIKIGIPKKAEIVIPFVNSQSSSSFTKCRCDLAKFIKVEKIYLAASQRKGTSYGIARNIDICDITNYIKKEYDINQLTYISTYDSFFEYEINKYVKPKYTFDTSPYSSCASGIHFVNTIDEAKKYFKEVVLNSADIDNIKEVKVNGIFNKNGN